MPENSVIMSKAKSIWLVYLQILLTLICAAGFLLASGFEQAWSAALGGLVIVIPTLYFRWSFFKKTSPQNPKAMIRNMVRSEIIKLTLLAIIFIMFLQIPGVKHFALIIGFIVAQMSIFIMPWVIEKG